MTTYKKIMNIALPAMAENFLQMLMGMVDNYLVASLGLIAISGVSVAGNIITIYQAIFIDTQRVKAHKLVAADHAKFASYERKNERERQDVVYRRKRGKAEVKQL